MPWTLRLCLAFCLGLLGCCRPSSDLPRGWSSLKRAAEAAPARRPQAATAHAAARHALLVGIDEYSPPAGSTARTGHPAERRAIPNLWGAVNDVQEMREMLIARYGFAPQDVHVLIDHEATRAAILAAFEQYLIAPSGKGDVVFFHWSGHGSQAPSPTPTAPHHVDTTLVPADAALGVDDIPSKRLRRLFNEILDRGAHLTILLDSCYSAAGARGLPAGARYRSVERAAHPIADAEDAGINGPLPEERGALLLAASQADAPAYESDDERGQPHGAFSLAMLHAMRDAVAGEPARDTFARARARLQAERSYQEPALGGTDAVRRAALLGQPADDRASRIVVAVEQVMDNGTIVLQGGRAYGLTEGSELRLLAPGPEVRIQLTKVDGFSRSYGRLLPGPAGLAPPALRPGALAEIMQWTAQLGAPLQVWIETLGNLGPALRLAQDLERAAPQHGVEWVEDPTATAPTHVLRWHEHGWQLLAQGRAERLDPAADATAILAKVTGSGPRRLFVQLPAPGAITRGISLGPGTLHSGIEITARPESADYVLAGRLGPQGLELAWLRPGEGREDQWRTSLPVRTAWRRAGPEGSPATSSALERDVLLLRKIHGWLTLKMPPGTASPYELTLRRDGDGTAVTGGTLSGGTTYRFVLRARSGAPAATFQPRYFYVFLIDSHGRSTLLFPRNSIAQPFPAGPAAPPEIPLIPGGGVTVAEPYGMDTYFLLSSDEAIADPWILDWDGPRARGPRGHTGLDELLAQTGGWARGGEPPLVPAGWSVERKLFESVPPGTPQRDRPGAVRQGASPAARDL
jgi:hypothetical protein